MRPNTALIAGGEEEIEGKPCRVFAFGVNTAEAFTAEEHYAVGYDGNIYVLDIAAGRYIPFSSVIKKTYN
jgi:hypothetical protein